MDEVGVDAARWYLVNRGPDQTIEIDLDLAAEKSQKNPVYYVQYAHARIAAILRNAGVGRVRRELQHRLAPEERELIKRLTDFPVTVREAADRRGPQLISGVRDQARRRLPSLLPRVPRDRRRPRQAFRLGLCRATQRVIARCLDLRRGRGPERM